MNNSNRSFISHAKDLISCSNTHTIEELSEILPADIAENLFLYLKEI